MAVLLHERLAKPSDSKPLILPETQVDGNASGWHGFMAKAIDKGWFAAAARSDLGWIERCREFQSSLAQMLTEQKPSSAAAKPTLRELHAELLGLYDEFPNADCNLRRKTISVITDSVTLEEVYLGPFSHRTRCRQSGAG